MPVFMTQGKYSTSAIKGLIQGPVDWEEEARRLIESNGGRLLGYYVMLGEYDWMIIYENVDPMGPLPGLAAVAATGAVSDIKTTLGYTFPEAKLAFERAQRQNVRTPFAS